MLGRLCDMGHQMRLGDFDSSPELPGSLQFKLRVTAVSSAESLKQDLANSSENETTNTQAEPGHSGMN